MFRIEPTKRQRASTVLRCHPWQLSPTGLQAPFGTRRPRVSSLSWGTTWNGWNERWLTALPRLLLSQRDHRRRGRELLCLLLPRLPQPSTAGFRRDYCSAQDPLWPSRLYRRSLGEELLVRHWSGRNTVLDPSVDGPEVKPRQLPPGKDNPGLSLRTRLRGACC